MASSSTSLSTSFAMPDLKFGRTSISSPLGSTRPPPPFHPTPPPFSSNSSLKNSTSQSPQYFQTGNPELHQTSVGPSLDLVNLSASRSMLNSYPSQPLMQPLFFRPSSMPGNLYGNNLVPHHGDNLPHVSQNLSISMPSVQPIPTLTQLQPLQPPQIPRPPPQHLRPPGPSSSQPPEQGIQLLQGPLHIPAQSLQVPQQPQVSPANVYYQTQQQENASNSLQQQHSQRTLHLPGDTTSEQQDSSMSLQEFFKSPEAIEVFLFPG